MLMREIFQVTKHYNVITIYNSINYKLNILTNTTCYFRCGGAYTSFYFILFTLLILLTLLYFRHSKNALKLSYFEYLILYQNFKTVQFQCIHCNSQSYLIPTCCHIRNMFLLFYGSKIPLFPTWCKVYCKYQPSCLDQREFFFQSCSKQTKFGLQDT